MRCVKCGRISLAIICKNCKEILRELSPKKREISGLNVYSFYAYSEIKELIHSKHHLHGLFVYKILANLSFVNFAKTYKFNQQINAIAIDDNVKSGYSHTAILAKALQTDEIMPIYGALRASSSVKYSGKSLSYRLKHKRGFKLEKQINFPVILVDDIVTTGTTLLEASEICKKNGINVLFALVLANAKE
ncbi:ComF family protein [Campylobacter geochelonis]|uniref:ComF family protein n=1 Tax=Campylobacter geochelonis TaxID=1780362 RepID=UPI000770811D|nr:ComF family protein [Campylobacter geochelonis]CZE47301.1 transformation system protein [Campylobacter geochelonis]CZE50528.1 transformation system protein [Campylobacter geochelonis]